MSSESAAGSRSKPTSGGKLASAALPLTVATLLLAVVGIAGAGVGFLSPVVGLLLFGLAAVFGGLGCLVSGVAALRARRHPDAGVRPGAGYAALATGSGLALLLGAFSWRMTGVPPIHDISTDTTNPPRFTAARDHPANRGRDLDYPEGSPDTALLQRAAYPDLRPIELAVGPEIAYGIALQVAGRLNWEVTMEDLAAGTFEAEAATSVFGFRDDIVVRVNAIAGGSVIDVRSTSRVGVSDVGANARRIRRFAAAVAVAVEPPIATTPVR